MPNNYRANVAEGWKKLAEAVSFCYGHRFARSVDYLSSLARNDFWKNSELRPLPWHNESPQARGNLVPRFVMHQAMLNALAPSVPLRAVFSREDQR